MVVGCCLNLVVFTQAYLGVDVVMSASIRQCNFEQLCKTPISKENFLALFLICIGST